MSAKAKHKLAKEAAENRMGVRFIRSQLQRKLDDELFKDCSRKGVHHSLKKTQKMHIVCRI